MPTRREHLLNQGRERRRKRVRAVIHGVSGRPRLAVFRSNKTISAQLIDDTNGTTLAAAHERELKDRLATPVDRARALGVLLAKKAKEKSIKQAVFDRRGYQFQGRVKALADGAREGGLLF